MRNVEVDDKDIQIMKLLTRDCRLSYREIGLNLGITTNTVKRRMNNLVSNQILDKFLVEVNLGAFGFNSICNLTIKHKSNREKIKKFLMNLGYVFLEVDCVGGISRFVIASREPIIGMVKPLQKSAENLQIIDIITGKWESNFILTLNDLRILKCLIHNPRTKIKDAVRTIHVSQKTIKRRTDILLLNRVIDFSILVNPHRMEGYINAGIFLQIEDKNRKVINEKIREEIKNLLVLEPPYEQLDMISFNVYVRNLWEIENIQNKLESMKGVKNISIIFPLRKRYSHDVLLKEIDKRIAKLSY